MGEDLNVTVSVSSEEGDVLAIQLGLCRDCDNISVRLEFDKHHDVSVPELPMHNRAENVLADAGAVAA